MANLFRTHRDQLLDVLDATIGEAVTALVDGKTVRCNIEDMTFDEIEIAGGRTNSAGYRLSLIPIESLSPKPEKGAPVIARGTTLDLLEIISTNEATYTVLAGSLLRGEQ